MLTAKAVQALKVTGKQYEVADGQVPGLRLRVSQHGTKTFMLLYHHRGSRRRLTIGRFPQVGLADARRLAQAARAETRSGRAPRSERQAATVALQTVPAMLEAFIDKHVVINNKAGTAEATSRILRKDIAQPWKDRDVRDVTRADVVRLIDRIAQERSSHAASNVFRAGRTFFNWMAGRSDIPGSPFEGLKDPAGAKTRDRILADDEIAAIWWASHQLNAPWGTIVRLLVVTGRRRAEVAEAAWQELNFADGIWSIPAHRTKSSRPSIKPITPGMRTQLQWPDAPTQGLVFPSQRAESKQAVSGFSKMKARLDALSDVRDWRLHDIRRTVATNLASLGVTDSTIARILDHRVVGAPDVTGIYNRYRYIPEMSDALMLWEEKLWGIVGSDSTVGEMHEG